MVRYVLQGGARHLFDPAVGAGAFFVAAKRVVAESASTVSLLGTELDPSALELAAAAGLSIADLAGVETRDFVLDPPAALLDAIVANPPYIRHHRLPLEAKRSLAALSARATGKPLDGRAGLHVYFLLQALKLLAPAGRLSFIIPADTFEGVFARPLWEWATANYALDAVLTFSSEASPFPGVDTNPVVVMIRNATPSPMFCWARCLEPDPDALAHWVSGGFRSPRGASIDARERTISEGVTTGLSRPPAEGPPAKHVLGDFATVMRGIATGANEFFHLTRSQAEALGVPFEFLRPAVGRTRDVQGDRVTNEGLRQLDANGRPTLLFSPDGRDVEAFPLSVRQYIRRGTEMGLPSRALISTRKPWYRMETRPVPPLLFAYLGRRQARFVRNEAEALPLTGFLCVYPRSDDPSFLDGLWTALSDPRTVAGLRAVGKSYGGDAVKVEPRALERLPIPDDLAEPLETALPLSRDRVQLALL